MVFPRREPRVFLQPRQKFGDQFEETLCMAEEAARKASDKRSSLQLQVLRRVEAIVGQLQVMSGTDVLVSEEGVKIKIANVQLLGEATPFRVTAEKESAHLVASASESLRCGELDNIHAELFGVLLAELAQMDVVWREGMRSTLIGETEKLEACIPKWAAVKNQICAEDQNDVRVAMVKNEKFAEIGPLVASLSQKLGALNAMVGIVETEVLTKARAAVRDGTETVCVTFALHVLYNEVPKEPLATKRQKLISDLKQEMSQKGVEPGESMAAKMDALQASGKSA
eukprot:6490412-Amphidinium_carterae.3